MSDNLPPDGKKLSQHSTGCRAPSQAEADHEWRRCDTPTGGRQCSAGATAARANIRCIDRGDAAGPDRRRRGLVIAQRRRLLWAMRVTRRSWVRGSRSARRAISGQALCQRDETWMLARAAGEPGCTKTTMGKFAGPGLPRGVKERSRNGMER